MDLDSLFNGDFAQSREQLKLNLAKVEASFRHDFREQTIRPSAPWDQWMIDVSQITNSLALLYFARQLKEKCQSQVKRSGVSTRSRESIAVLERFLESLLATFTLDLEKASQALQAASAENLSEQRTVPDQDTQALVHLLTQELIEPGDPWSPREDLFHPGTSINALGTTREWFAALVKEVPIRLSEHGYLDLRRKDSTIPFLTFQDMLDTDYQRDLFWRDAVFLAADLAWILIFCHSGFAVFAKRRTEPTRSLD